MGCGSRPGAPAGAVAGTAFALALALLAGVAQAKPWEGWAPAPLASDSAYAALSALPTDYFAPDVRDWLAVQRDWRAQRIEVAGRSATFITAYHPQPARPADERCAALASLPYAALADGERTWLVAEDAAQRKDRRLPEGTEKSSAVVGIAMVALLVGFLAGLAAFAYALGHTSL
jgi:hypothetical protein